MEKLSYALGMIIGHNLKGMNVTNLNGADFAKAVEDVLSGAKTALSDTEAQQLVTDYLQRQEAEKGAAAREAGEKFLAENAKKEGVTVLPSGLQYSVITEGKGPKMLWLIKARFCRQILPLAQSECGDFTDKPQAPTLQDECHN